VFKKTAQEKTLMTLIVVSILGILFSGRFVISEFVQWFKTGFEWSALGLPTCAYGLIFYMLVLVFTLRYQRSFQAAL
jgi:ribose/xylose/arabinose/galactoside ABC-type transport system permease subunit